MKTQSTQDDPIQDAERPRTVTVAAGIAALEGVLVAGWALYMVIEGLVGHPDSPARAEVGGVAVLCIALMPLFAARGLLRMRSWSRGPALVVQLLALPVAWGMTQNGGKMIAAGAVLAAVGLSGAVALVHPATTAALDGSRRAEPAPPAKPSPKGDGGPGGGKPSAGKSSGGKPSAGKSSGGQPPAGKSAAKKSAGAKPKTGKATAKRQR